MNRRQMIRMQHRARVKVAKHGTIWKGKMWSQNWLHTGGLVTRIIDRVRTYRQKSYTMLAMDIMTGAIKQIVVSMPTQTGKTERRRGSFKAMAAWIGRVIKGRGRHA